MGKRKEDEARCRLKHARSVHTVTAAHPAERSTQEEVVLATSGGCLDAARSRTRAGPPCSK